MKRLFNLPVSDSLPAELGTACTSLSLLGLAVMLTAHGGLATEKSGLAPTGWDPGSAYGAAAADDENCLGCGESYYSPQVSMVSMTLDLLMTGGPEKWVEIEARLLQTGSGASGEDCWGNSGDCGSRSCSTGYTVNLRANWYQDEVALPASILLNGMHLRLDAIPGGYGGNISGAFFTGCGSVETQTITLEGYAPGYGWTWRPASASLKAKLGCFACVGPPIPSDQ